MELFLLIVSLILLAIELKPKKKFEYSEGNYRDALDKIIDDKIPDTFTTELEKQTFKDIIKLIVVIAISLLYLIYIIWYMIAYSYIGNIVALSLSTILIIQTLFNIKKLFNVVYGTDELKLPNKIIVILFKLLDVGYIGYVIFSIIQKFIQ